MRQDNSDLRWGITPEELEQRRRAFVAANPGWRAGGGLAVPSKLGPLSAVEEPPSPPSRAVWFGVGAATALLGPPVLRILKALVERFGKKLER